MKITCEREQLLTAFQAAASVAPSRSPKPILQNIKLEVSADTAMLLATDLDVGIRVQVPGIAVEAAGSAILHPASFGSILRESTDASLRLEADPQGTLIRGERSEFRLPGADPLEFPSVAEFHETKYHEISARLFREMIHRTVFATDNESTRYALGGVLIELDSQRIIAVGTDGRRLATMSGPAKAVEGHATSEQMTIVPARSMQLIERVLGDAEGDIRLAAKPNSVLVQTPQATVFSRLVEGRYPKWREVLPQRDGSAKIELPVGLLHSAVRQAQIVTSKESRGVDFTFEEGRLTLSGRSAESGQSRVELPISYAGSAISITLDPRYVGEFLKVLDPDKNFTMDVQDAENAAVCISDDGYQYVIMPLARDQ